MHIHVLVYVFLFQPNCILCSALFLRCTTVLQCARMYVYIHVHKVMFVLIVYIMQIHIPMIAEVKMLQRQIMLYVHHMHTLVCRVFKWNYEQHIYGHTFIPTDIRFAPTNVPLIIWLS